MDLFEAAVLCVVCGREGQIVTKALNGLPKGLPACEGCVEAVRRREVGVVIRKDGTLHVTDGRKEKEPV